MAEKKRLRKIFDRGVERWTQSAFFTDTATRRALKSLGFRRPVENFVKSPLKKTTEERRIPAKAKFVPPPELSVP